MKVLVLSHVLPGDAASGAARVEWLAKGLAAHGVETHVLALRREGTRRADGAPEPEPGAATVVPFRGRDGPGRLASLFSRDGGFARTVVESPDQAGAVRKGLEAAERLRPDAVLSTAPPRRVNEVACRIAGEAGLAWVIDWQDPDALRPLNVWPSRAYYRACAEREGEWVRRAALHVVTAPSHARLLAERRPGAKVATVPVGWTPAAPGASPERGRLVYSGSLTPDLYGFAEKFPWKLSMRLRSRLTLGRWCHAPFDREVDYRAWGIAALEAVARCRDRVASLEFRGARDPGVALRRARRLGLGRIARAFPWTTPRRAADDLAGAHVLWLCCAGTSARGGEPVVLSKAAGYLASGRPVLAVLPPECDTAGILRGQPGVFLPDPADARAVEGALREALALPPGKRFDRDVDHLRADRLAGELAGLLEEAVGGATNAREGAESGA